MKMASGVKSDADESMEAPVENTGMEAETNSEEDEDNAVEGLRSQISEELGAILDPFKKLTSVMVGVAGAVEGIGKQLKQERQNAYDIIVDV